MWVANRKGKEFSKMFEEALKDDDEKGLSSLFKENEISNIESDLGKSFLHPNTHYYLSISSCAFFYNAEKCLDLIKSLGHKFDFDEVCAALEVSSLHIIQKFCDDLILAFEDDKKTKFSFKSFQDVAARRGSLEILKYLYSKGLSFGKKPSRSFPILKCSENGNLECFKFLAEITNLGEEDIKDFTQVVEKAAKYKHSQIIDYLYDNYSDHLHRDAIKPSILPGDALQSFIKEYGSDADITKEILIALAKNDSFRIINHLFETGATVPELSLDELSHCNCPRNIILLTKGREKAAFMHLVAQKCFLNCSSLLDVIALTPRERGFAMQQF